ncbi:hypothetical protein L3Y34_009740 [Caenorhabditis briggsae]|uniref:Uncharacterized protein n=1 Tax=Caenorhabditis briggsae TaxID=6238 RepID=A0AAE9ACT9_CAEBR|nr:hypothetical protein L3Y34_009740 [Caenorhabditis briggsae]
MCDRFKYSHNGISKLNVPIATGNGQTNWLFRINWIVWYPDVLDKSKEQSDNLTILILFMTVSFMLSEGLDGIRSFLLITSYSWSDEYSNIRKFLLSSQYIIISLRCFNSISHLFVCYSMSSQYRNTFKYVFFLQRKAEIKIIPVKSVNSKSMESSRKIRSRTLNCDH